MDEEMNKWMSLWQSCDDNIREHLIKMCPKLKGAGSL